MADYTMYHSMGQPGAPGNDQTRQQLSGPPPNSFSPPAPAGYQHPGAPYGVPQPSQFAGQPDAGYNTGTLPSPAGTAEGNMMGGLTAQMGGLGITSDVGARGHKKKSRHAYHDIGAPTTAGSAPQGFNNFPPPNSAQSSQFLNTGLNQQDPGFVSPGADVLQPANPAAGGAPQPGFHTGAVGSVAAQGKIDPEQIPSIPRSRDIPAQYYFNHVYPTMEQHVPPPATIPFVAHDQGNSSPKFARLTLNNIPTSSEFLNSTGLPLGLVLQPFARLDPGEQPIPLIDFGESGPPRCRRCRTYINPFMVFRSGGNKFVCNMCTFPNEVPPEYYAPVDPSGARVDRMQRPELMMGTVEFTVPKEYWNKEPVGLRQLFLIDVSQESVNRGFLEGVCEGIMNALYGEEEDAVADGNDDETTTRKLPEGSTIGIVTFDKEVQFYNLSVSHK